MCQVGAIILYTYVFNMLAPPSEGSFDLDEINLPIKNPQQTSKPEQVPLLPQEEPAPEELSTSRKGKVEPVNSLEFILSVPEEFVLMVNCLSCINAVQVKRFIVFLFEKLKLNQILQPPIIASVSLSVLYS